MDINKNDTAVVVTDPQNDVVSTTGVAWGLVGESTKRVASAAGEGRWKCNSCTNASLPVDRVVIIS